MTRGLVVPLTSQQVVARALYLAGEVPGTALDEFVRQPFLECPTLLYRLPYPQGGDDPTAPHPTHTDPDGTHHADCMAGAAWCGGFDRKQAVRFAHLYGGSINTNSMILDAIGAAKCFVSVGRPEPGSFIVCKSGSPGHRVGHIGTVVGYRLAEWDPTVRSCWAAIEVVDIAGRTGRANKRTTGIGWRGTGALFVRSIMQP